jgi:hypothetical protein
LETIRKPYPKPTTKLAREIRLRDHGAFAYLVFGAGRRLQWWRMRPTTMVAGGTGTRKGGGEGNHLMNWAHEREQPCMLMLRLGAAWSFRNAPPRWHCDWHGTQEKMTVFGELVRPCLVTPILLQILLCKRRFSVTSKCRQMHEVLNVDEIKN